jgi:ATP-binding cassette subfamily F protein 3
MLVADIRKYLARYLFVGDDVFKPVEVLSGGERGRLSLAKLALTNANLLILDEPTNHLDIPAQEVLQNVLADFEGTIILVSHDRYLIDALSTQIWEIDKNKELLNIFNGTYSEYRNIQEQNNIPIPETNQKKIAKIQSRKKKQAATNLEIARERRRISRIQEIEARISELENELSTISESLSSPPENPEEVQYLGDQYVEIQNELEALITEWEALHK